MDLLKVGTCKEEEGKITKGNLVVKLKDRKVNIPVFIISGNQDGPTGFISAGMHGDELNGIQIVKIIKDMLKPNSLKGRLVIVPVINTLGFKEGKRYVPIDDKDLNRQFNQKSNSASSKIAKAFMKEVVSKCDFGIDCHDSNSENILLPHPRILCNNEAPEVTELSRIFGTDLIMERVGGSGMLAIEAYRKLKVPVLTVEVGGGARIWDEFVDEGVKGILNILVYKKMISGIIDVPVRQFILDVRHGYVAPFSGLVDVKVNLGDAVKEDEVIATLYDPEKDLLKEIKADHPGVVFSVRLKSKINKGETMFSVLHFKQGKDKAYALNAEMILNKEALQGIILRPTKVLDTFLSIFDSSYSLLDTALGSRLNKIKNYFKK